jgi:hypothetical protein
MQCFIVHQRSILNELLGYGENVQCVFCKYKLKGIFDTLASLVFLFKIVTNLKSGEISKLFLTETV